MSDRLSTSSSRQLKWSGTTASISSIKEEGDNEECSSISKFKHANVDDDDDDDIEDEMTSEEQESMYNAVKIGDIDRLEELLEKPNADIKMLWYSENLLMTAIRFGQEEMSEFLLDNGVDQNHSLLLIRNPEAGIGKTEQFTYTCRQMAYDHEMFDIVEIIDVLNNQLFPGVKPRQRVPRYRREKPPTPLPELSPANESDAFETENKAEKHRSAKRKVKKLVKRVSADLLSLMDESDDESQKNTKKLPRRSSLPPGVGRKKKSTKSEADSVDHDSGIQSIEPEKTLSEKSSKRHKTLKSKRVTLMEDVQSVTKSNMEDEVFLPVPPNLSLHSDPKVKSVDKKKKTVSTKFKIFGNVARASRPVSAYQYVTDHSRCRTLGFKQEPNPLILDKIKCHGSYFNESLKWRTNGKEKVNHGIFHNRRVFSAPSPRHYSQIHSNVFEDNYFNNTYIASPSKRKLDPKFRRSYLTLNLVPSFWTMV